VKSFIATVALLASMSSFATEIKVLEIPQNYLGNISARFKINLEEGTAGVKVLITRRTGGKNSHTSIRRFEAAIPELSMNGENLEFNKDGTNAICGTMGVTRIFKIPTLKLSGNCDFVTKRVNGKIVVSLVNRT
jgi:hypothetical protein